MLRKFLRLGSTARCSVFLKQVRLDDAVFSDDVVCRESTTIYSNGEITINSRVQTSPGGNQHTVTTVEDSQHQAVGLVEYPSGKSSIFLQGSEAGKDLTDTTPVQKCKEIKDFFINNNLAASIFCNKIHGRGIEEALVEEGHKVITPTNKM